MDWLRACAAHHLRGGVASLPEGGIFATSLWNPNDPNNIAELEAGEPTGGVNEWHAATGWSPLPGSTSLSGANGILASPDGKEIYIALSGTDQIMRVSRVVSPVVTQFAAVSGFTVDNLRWLPGEESFFVGGEAAYAPTVLNCFLSDAATCPIGIGLDLVEPQSLRMTPVLQPGVVGEFSDGTGAILEDDNLWLSTFAPTASR